MTDLQLRPTQCAICQTFGNASEIYAANFDSDAFNPAVFSARRLPDRIHYRMVQCITCGLVRSDPVTDHEMLAQLYRQSTFEYGPEVEHLKRSYSQYLTKAFPTHSTGGRGALLEVGCGNGFVLEEALKLDFQVVKGVEPSASAVDGASAVIRPHLTCDILKPGIYEPQTFDAIAMFQVFDHLPDPAAALDECLRLLKPGGRLLLLNHNIKALSAKVLGEGSPIIDIEHTYLYSPATLRQIVELSGFHYEFHGSVYNQYSLSYLTRLVPLPNRFKRATLQLLSGSGIGKIPLRVPLGNLYLVASKP